MRVADETGLVFHVHHYPPGTSKWNTPAPSLRGVAEQAVLDLVWPLSGVFSRTRGNL
jgi:DDE family transposase